ncbi:MAG: hypothetical protein E7055_16305 [Lentisphaerae bacterium]|nr:hypothetical protein [Lentisphaerota bacterium]
MNGVPLQSPVRDWVRIDGTASGEIRREQCGAFRRVFYRHQLKENAKALGGRRILFFSDLHIRPQTARSFPVKMQWNGMETIRDFLLDTIEKYQPDHLFCGGDLMAYVCCFSESAELFRSLSCPGLKIAVYGNWDLMRPWLPAREWQRMIEQTGLRLLVNEAAYDGPMRIFGLDEIRKGSPEYYPGDPPPAFECVLAHNPDTIPQVLSAEMLGGIDLILCGHTHGGQIRIPGFGAVMCSSVHWKKFEYGLYRNRKTGTRLLVTAGLGVTFIRQRIFCPPEAVIIDLAAE